MMKGVSGHRGQLEAIYFDRFPKRSAGDTVDDGREHRQGLRLSHLNEFHVSTELFDEVVKSFFIVGRVQQTLLQHLEVLGEIAGGRVHQ